MSGSERLSASLTLSRGAAKVGLQRIELLEAIGELGSISAASRRLGLSYRGAWDGVQALNNLFDGRLVEAVPGGRSGGTASLTPQGQALVAAFRQVAGEVDSGLARLESRLAEGDLVDLFWTLGLRTSARNALRGKIVAIECETVSGEVRLSITDAVEIVARVTRHSIENLGLEVGRPAIALIKANFLTLAPQAPAVTDGLNLLAGRLVDREDGEGVSELRVEIGGGKTLVATAPLDEAHLLMPNQDLVAMVKASHVILAVD